MNSFSSLFSLMVKFRRLGLNLLCSSCVHSIPARRNKWDFYSFQPSQRVRAGDVSGDGVTDQTAASALPDFLQLGRAIPVSSNTLGQEQECSAASQGTWREQNPPQKWGVRRTQRHLKGLGENSELLKLLELLHAKANPWKTRWELPGTHVTSSGKYFFSSGVSSCLRKGKLGMRAGAVQTPRILKPICWCAPGAPFQHLSNIQTWHCHRAHPCK